MLNLISLDGKVGDLEMAKSLFLFLKFNNDMECPQLDKVYCFNNDTILTVDSEEYNTEGDLLKVQEELDIRPYFVTRNVFKEFILYSCDNKDELLLRNIKFFDDYIMEEDEYIDLEKNIREFRFNNLYKQVKAITQEFQTNIKEIVLRYKGYEFKLTSEGVLTYDAPVEIFEKFLMDKKISSLILG